MRFTTIAVSLGFILTIAAAATDTTGAANLERFHATAADEFKRKREPGTCDPAVKKPQLDAYAFLGSGFLLAFYQGMVQALQDRGVLTPKVMATAKIAGFSGGSLTAVLTGLGWSGSKQFALFRDIAAAIGDCKAAAKTDADKLKCTLNVVGIPIVRTALSGTDVPSIINGRVSLWACQVNAMGTSLNGSVTVGTKKWSSNDDVLANVMVSDQIACFTTDTFYNIFRGEPYIDGGYCTDFDQLCPRDKSRCLKMSTEFMGPDLPAGTPFPTVDNCLAYVVPPNYLPNVGKTYATPKNQSTWTLPRGSCLSEEAKAAVNISPTHVPQGVTAKPDIHPAFYAPLPPEFEDGCAWLKAGLVPNALNATFQHGYDSAAGWADAHGYCK